MAIRRLGSKAATVVLALLVADSACTLLYLNQVNRYSEALRPPKSDVAVVLFSDFARGGLGAETLRRVSFAAKMFEQGAFDYIVCAGGARPSRNVYGSELMRQWFLAAGILPDRLYLEKRSNDTRSNLIEGFRMVREKGWQTACVVSSPLHVFRIKEIVREVEGSLSVLLAAYSYGDCRPAMGRVALWGQTHYEWASRLLPRMLPIRMYEKMIEMLRG